MVAYCTSLWTGLAFGETVAAEIVPNCFIPEDYTQF